jgi:hypothetical protein
MKIQVVSAAHAVKVLADALQRLAEVTGNKNGSREVCEKVAKDLLFGGDSEIETRNSSVTDAQRQRPFRVVLDVKPHRRAYKRKKVVA